MLRRGLLVTLGAGLAVLAVVLGWGVGLEVRFSGGDSGPPPAPAPTPELPAALAPGLGPPAAPVLPDAAAAGRASLIPTGVRRILAPALADPDLGAHVGVRVLDLSRDEAVFSRRAGERFIPASTLKLLTVTAALTALGPEHRFHTTVVRSGPKRVVLVGGGDPLLTRFRPSPGAALPYPGLASVAELAARTAQQLRSERVRGVRLGYDDSLFRGPAVNPAWATEYVLGDVVSPISALWVDEGRARPGFADRVTDPAFSAAEAFAAALERRGIQVRGRPRATHPPRSVAPVAAVSSLSLERLVEHVLLTSDNEAAEVLARHVALASGEPASFAGAAAAVERVVGRLGVRLRGARVLDGSGLARGNRLTPATITDLLRLAALGRDGRLRPVVTRLPVAGFSGSLAYRFLVDARAGVGYVRAKTGTLSRVHGLAGLTVTRGGSLAAFAVLTDGVALPDTLDARAVLDQIAARLTACGCR